MPRKARDRRLGIGGIVDTIGLSVKERSEGTVHYFSIAVKVMVYCLPAIILTELAHSKNHLAIAASWVAGALLQALIPPAAKKGLLPILGLTLVVGAAYVIFWK